MPKPGQRHAISEADRLRYQASWAQMQEQDPSLRLEDAGRKVGLKKATLSKILSGKQKDTTAKAALDRYFGAPPEKDRLIQAIIAVTLQLDETRRHKLHERALALLDEQLGDG